MKNRAKFFDHEFKALTISGLQKPYLSEKCKLLVHRENIFAP